MFIQKSILTTTEIPTGVKNLIRTLHHDFTDRHGLCWPSVHTISTRMSCSIRSVQRYIKLAVELGLMSVKRRWLKTSVYRLLCLVRPNVINKGDTVSSKLYPSYKENVSGNAFSIHKQKQPSGNAIVREIESIMNSTKDRRCWEKVVRTCSIDTIHRAISSLKIAMNEISLMKPGAYLVSVLKAEHPGLFGGVVKHPAKPIAPIGANGKSNTDTPPQIDWETNMAGVRAIMAKLNRLHE